MKRCTRFLVIAAVAVSGCAGDGAAGGTAEDGEGGTGDGGPGGDPAAGDCWTLELALAGDVEAFTRTTDGGYAFAGALLDRVAMRASAWVAKVDASGTLLWEHVVDGQSNYKAIAALPDGGVAAAGQRTRMFVQRLDAAGASLGEPVEDPPFHRAEQAFALAAKDDGTVAMTGTGRRLVVVDAAGAIAFSTTLRQDDVDSNGWDIASHPDGGWVVVGSDEFGNDDGIRGASMWAGHVDAAGTPSWELSVSPGAVDRASTMGYAITAHAGGFLLFGQAGFLSGPPYLHSIDNAGATRWSRELSAEVPEGRSIQPIDAASLPGGDAVIAATARRRADNDVWVARVDSDGQLVWSRSFSGDERSAAPAGISSTPGGGVVLGGERGAESFGSQFVLELDADGVPTCE